MLKLPSKFRNSLVATGPTLVLNLISYVPHPFLELDGRFLCRVSVLHLDVVLAANTCHGFMLLFLQISQKHVAIQIIQCCRMVEQLGNGHGHFHGLVYSVGHSACVATGIGRFVAEGMARLCDFSHELH